MGLAASRAVAPRRILATFVATMALIAAPLIGAEPAAAAGTGTITGAIYEDINGSGDRQGSDPAVQGRTVFVDLDSDGVLDGGEPSALSGTLGTFTLTNVPTGSHPVVAQSPAGWVTSSAPISPAVNEDAITSGIEIGTFRLGTISGTVYEDTNGNAFRNADDTGVAGIPVYLDTNDNGSQDGGEENTVTASDGTYSFANVGPGSYPVRVVVPSGTVQTNSGSFPVNMTSGANAANVDFGLFAQGSISGWIYRDYNGNATRDAGEPGSAGATVFLDVNRNGVLDGPDATRIADGAGAYAFDSLDGGTYDVRVVIPSGWGATSPHPVTKLITSATYEMGVNIGISDTGVIRGSVYNDVNNNGILESGEAGRAGDTVFVDLNNNGALDIGEESAITDADGVYDFVGLGPGSYYIRVVVPSGTTRSGTNPPAIVITPGSVSNNVNFGLFTQGVISGTIYEDVDGNGTQDAGDDGVGPRVVFLDTNNNNAYNAGEPQTTTDTSGNYTFINVASGTYRVRVTPATGEIVTSALPNPVTITSAASVTGVTIGLFKQGTIAGAVFNDLNGNGQRDAGEVVKSTSKVFLDLNNNGIKDASEPQASMTATVYTFSALGPGTYKVRFIPEVGVNQTSALNADVVLTSAMASTGNDLGVFTLGKISGTAFNDTNGNGIKNTGEPAISTGRTAYLDTNDNGVLDPGETSIVSGGTGVYSFTGLSAGTYRIRFVLPAGQFKTSPDYPDIVISSGSDVTARDFGTFTPANVSGVVFDDTNGDTTRNAGEPPRDNVVLFLDANDNGVFDSGETSTASNSTGAYIFTGLAPGSYRVRATTPVGTVRTTANPSVIVPTSGSTAANTNFGFFTFASIGGTVYDDTNGNGAMDSGEPVLSGQVVFADLDLDGVFDLNEPTATTDTHGIYTIGQLPKNTYRLRLVVPSGYTQTSVNPAPVTTTSGAVVPNINFGLFTQAAISGVVFEDTNGNGTLDTGETGMVGRTLFLDKNNNGRQDAGEPQTVTDSTGNYMFAGLGAGTYNARIVLPSQYVQTTTDPAGVVAQSGGNSANNNFGLFAKATITGNVYTDAGGDGIKDASDGPRFPATVWIDFDGDSIVDTNEKTSVTSTGVYTFPGLGPGSYVPQVVVPDGSVLTSAPLAPVVPLSGSVNAGRDFGLFVYAVVAGSVFDDKNGNGVKNSGELAIGGRTVYLDTNNNGEFDSGEPNQLTDTTGSYRFDGLLAGNYRPRLVVPAGSLQTTPDPNVVSATSGTSSILNHFALFTLAAISGTVYDDIDGNRSKGAAEPGLSGYRVFLDLNQNTTLDTGEPNVLTDALGYYVFNGLAAGSFRVRPVLPDYVSQTTSVLPLVNTTSGVNAGNNNIGLFRQGTVRGTVFADDNGNGARDAGESPMPGRTVYVDTNGNGQVNVGEVAVDTDTDGNYTIRGLGLGTYKIRLAVPGGFKQTNDLPAPIAIKSGDTVSAVSFGLFAPGTITGKVFMDQNKDGTLDPADTMSSGRQVYVDVNDNGKREASELTVQTVQGVFTFPNLNVGTYRIRLVLPTGMWQTSDAPAPIVIGSGSTVTDINFGLALGSPPVSTPPTDPGNPSDPGNPGTPGTPPAEPGAAGTGYWLTSAGGEVFNYGSAKKFGEAATYRPNAPIVSLAPTISGSGYWQVATDGGIFAFGDATFNGSMGGKPLNKPIVGMAAKPSGSGYWMVASDGGIFAFGDAGFYGSMGGKPLNQPIVGMLPTPSGNGYWMVASDGGIFAFGDATFYGSAGSLKLNKPIVGMAASAHGYWMVASDGGIFAYGDAKFYGSMGGKPLNRPIVSMRAPADGSGYWMFASDGGVFAFGSARFYGGTPPAASPIVY